MQRFYLLRRLSLTKIKWRTPADAQRGLKLVLLDKNGDMIEDRYEPQTALRTNPSTIAASTNP
jgi:hypothetical protein